MALVPWPGGNNNFFELHIRKKITLIRRGKEIRISFQSGKGKYSNQKKIHQLEKGQYYNLRKKTIPIRKWKKNPIWACKLRTRWRGREKQTINI